MKINKKIVYADNFLRKRLMKITAKAKYTMFRPRTKAQQNYK